MKLRSFGVCSALTAALAVPAAAVMLPLVNECPPDAVLVGPTCVDRYEASVWMPPEVDNGNLVLKDILKVIKRGSATFELLVEFGWTQVSPGRSCAPSFPSTFPADGQWTKPLYAVSIPGVPPTACVTWFQADQACRLSGKHLLTNLEWQDAAAGTPDTGVDDGTIYCNVASADVVNTGSRSSCTSKWGAVDMVGNVSEWVAEWVPASTWCSGWGGFSDDLMCLAGASTTQTSPGALLRGGDFTSGSNAGPLAVVGSFPAKSPSSYVGFRCAR
jgi:hypothetical protein